MLQSIIKVYGLVTKQTQGFKLKKHLGFFLAWEGHPMPPFFSWESYPPVMARPWPNPTWISSPTDAQIIWHMVPFPTSAVQRPIDDLREPATHGGKITCSNNGYIIIRKTCFVFLRGHLSPGTMTIWGSEGTNYKYLLILFFFFLQPSWISLKVRNQFWLELILATSQKTPHLPTFSKTQLPQECFDWPNFEKAKNLQKSHLKPWESLPKVWKMTLDPAEHMTQWIQMNHIFVHLWYMNQL